MNLLHKIAPAFKSLDNLAEQLADQADKLRAFAEERRAAADHVRADAMLAIERADAMLHEAKVADILATDILKTLDRAEVETSVMI